MRKGVVGERGPRKESRAQCVALALHRGAPPAPRQGDMEKGEVQRQLGEGARSLMALIFSVLSEAK